MNMMDADKLVSEISASTNETTNFIVKILNLFGSTAIGHRPNRMVGGDLTTDIIREVGKEKAIHILDAFIASDEVCLKIMQFAEKDGSHNAVVPEKKEDRIAYKISKMVARDDATKIRICRQVLQELRTSIDQS